MKITAIACLALALVSSTVAACPPVAYIGLYADPSHSICRVNPAPYVPFDVWVWFLPSTHGVKCVEFGIAYPSSVVPLSVTYNPDIAPMACGVLLENGYSCCFQDCQFQWNWVFHVSCMQLTATADFIQLAPHPQYGGPRVATCEEGFPAAPVIILNHLALNQPCIVGVNESSWGAIKALYR